jgi:hypothetical protein
MRVHGVDAEGHLVSVILVIRPDPSQAKILRDVAKHVVTELLIVDSAKRAVEAIGRQVPDLILLSAFLSPRDEDTLMARLRSLDGTSHLQTLSIPQFCSSEDSRQKKKTGFGFRKKQKAPVLVGADPAAFAEEVRTLLERAREIRNRPAPPQSARTVIVDELSDVAIEEFVAFEPFDMEPPVEEPVVETAIADEAVVQIPAVGGEPLSDVYVAEEPLPEAPVAREAAPRLKPALSMADEIDELVRRLGLDVKLGGDTDEASGLQRFSDGDDTDVFDVGASPDQASNEGTLGLSPVVSLPELDVEASREAAISDALAMAEQEAREASSAELARVQADAERLHEAAVAEARGVAEREAREALAADLQRAQIEAAERIRETAIAEARAEAEREAREALAADLQRVQAEAEQMRETAIAEARATAEREARDTLAVEVARVRSEAESTFTDALNKVRTEAGEAERRHVEAERAKAERLNAEAQQAFARELARVRSEVEQSLAVQLDAARVEAERIRIAETEAVHERAAVEIQLKADLDRLRFVTAQTRKADESETRKAALQIKQLEAELATVRAKAEARKGDEFEELRAQITEMREAAAQHARAAAAEAVAAEVARATMRPTAVIAQFPSGAVTRINPPAEAIAQSGSRDYLSLWQPRPPEPVAVENATVLEVPVVSIAVSSNIRRHAKWAVPVAACLLLVANTGTAISTVARFVQTDERPTAVVQPMHQEPAFIEVVEKRVGQLKVDSTPSGAEAILGGKSYGRTPVTIPDLDVGVHTLVLKSRAGNITRRVTIKPNRTTVLTEGIYSGWLAIFSPIPVSIRIDGQAVNLSEDGRLMTTPGAHVVEFISEQFNYRAKETLDVRPGETTAHTVTLPSGTVRVRIPEGSEVRVDGQLVPGNPSQAFPVAIGAHEISASHPELGERRVSVDVKHGGLTEVTLPYE